MTSRLTARQRRTNLILFCCGILVIALKLLLSPWPEAPAGRPGGTASAGAAAGASEQLSPEELARRSQEGVITITINRKPEFAAGDAAGDLRIRNAETNSHPVVVEITRSDTGESIYRSGVIPIGQGVDEAALAVSLPAGEYDCVATFSYVDEDTGEVLGSGGIGITIHVLG